ncbi:response regulator transcription factor [Modestobacter marinus]|uniref:LuxR C-terminal-related transcriptional regulator n=1 Tax=Modestobacter italicus (strain DSM 44449 / CECT 9708 / BC 501) TaxID=2732864 RepID=UPI001411E55E
MTGVLTIEHSAGEATHGRPRPPTPEPGTAGSGLRPPTTRPPRPLVRVLLCEDQEVFRLGLRVVLETQPDMAVVAETSHVAEALDVVDGPGAQVIVVAQGLVGPSGVPLLRSLCQRGTGVLVLAETRARGDAGLIEVLQAGVRGVLPRRSAAQSLVDAVRSLARQETALDAAVTSQLVRHLTGDAEPVGAGGRAVDQLTERQRDVALLVAEGLSNEEIAGRLFLSPATVKSHLTAVLRRLDIRTRTQLAILVNRDQEPAA